MNDYFWLPIILEIVSEFVAKKELSPNDKDCNFDKLGMVKLSIVLLDIKNSPKWRVCISGSALTYANERRYTGESHTYAITKSVTIENKRCKKR